MKYLKYFESAYQKGDLKMEDLKDSLLELTDWKECIFSDYSDHINIFIRLEGSVKEYVGVSPIDKYLHVYTDISKVNVEDENPTGCVEEFIKVVSLLKEGLERSQIEYKSADLCLEFERWSEYVLGDYEGDDEMCYIAQVQINYF